VAALRELYSSVDEIDLFVAAVAEKPLPGALLGQTLVCLVGDQFARLRRGDRFYYEEGGQPSSFSPRKYIHTRRLCLYFVRSLYLFFYHSYYNSLSTLAGRFLFRSFISKSSVVGGKKELAPPTIDF
jgi:hypothetical protein